MPALSSAGLSPAKVGSADRAVQTVQLCTVTVTHPVVSCDGYHAMNRSKHCLSHRALYLHRQGRGVMDRPA